jgi:multicomponent Na+:H+ antiporter subunit D
MISPENLIWISLALPLLAIGLIFLCGKIPNLRESCTILISVALFGLTCQLASHVFAGQRPSISLGEMMPGFE